MGPNPVPIRSNQLTRPEAKASYWWVLFLTAFFISSVTQGQGLRLTTAEIYAASGSAVIVVETDQSFGAGFILDASGQIATTFELIDGAERARVRMSSGDVFDRVRLIGVDRRLNLAVLEIEGFDLPSVRLGNSNSVETRDPVVVLGVSVSGEEFRPTISEGIVSGLRLEPEGFRTIQIEAAVSVESAGSPVLSRQGEVVGMMLSPGIDGQPHRAIPINYLRGLLRQ